jgi:hypothetical protein
LEEVKGLLKEGTPVSWFQKTLEEELWEEEQFQQGHTPLPPEFEVVKKNGGENLPHYSSYRKT